MNHFDAFLTTLSNTPVYDKLRCHLLQCKQNLIHHPPHGHWKKWMNILNKIPNTKASSIKLNQNIITIGEAHDISQEQSNQLYSLVKQFFPWRKGPYRLFDILIDSEWQSHIKWNRICRHFPPIQNKVVLDIGCGNGYYCWRLQGEGARITLGIDHTIIYFFQFLIFQKYIQSKNTALFPISLQSLATLKAWNDIIFSMGVLYHQKNPLHHLEHIYRLLKPDGHLILETLYITNSTYGEVLVPQGRYARMRNVHNIPSLKTLETWLKQSCFKNIQQINITQTTSQEQRSTSWMTGPSLQDFLDPHNSNLTIEGYPAPQRVTYLAQK